MSTEKLVPRKQLLHSQQKRALSLYPVCLLSLCAGVLIGQLFSTAMIVIIAVLVLAIELSLYYVRGVRR